MPGTRELLSFKWHWKWLLLLLLLTLGSVACPVLAQSTDPDHPTPWPSGGITSVSDGNRHTYYYIMDGGPGTLEITVQARARALSTSVSVDILDNRARDAELRRVGAIATSGAPVTERGNLTLSERRTLLLRLTIEVNAGNYSVQITGATGTAGSGSGGSSGTPTPVVGIVVDREDPWFSLPSGLLKDDGQGRAEHRFYYVDAGPGDVIVDLVAVGSASSTAVRVDIYDAAMHTIGTVTVTAPPGEQVYQRRNVAVSGRQRLHVVVTTDENTAHYMVNLSGSVHR